ncbi:MULTISPECIES: DUF6932 family protein [unclassified Rhodococcus (in: high G+C Gram-positive bacteria)]|uniref:DUF6932 family protein n=1 Tax=unclassified Rhodococcus (in: high G+C Gram-positive bacteria) TaxID=192944 RepID=UPI001AEAF2D0|nr:MULTISPECIES: hypothetical protein [unclassified Rhodococcus (in: high G+C Gram-positive bacteria)]MBP2523597.1 hypothetical protein [Rhodococcus sp. PvP104]MDA3634727.1 hypothetical protein [Rhodococcus sp. C-2]
MIPNLDPTSGHLPPGRFRCTLPEIEQRFVDDAQFATSKRRRMLFDQLLTYLRDWELALDVVSAPGVLKQIWIAGSFASAKIDPEDIDVSPILDGPLLREIRGVPGVRRIQRLQGEHRERIAKEYGVEPFPFTWWPVTTLRRDKVDNLAIDYIATRGLMDDFWQRTRSTDVKTGLTVDTAHARRGYLEVVVA